MDYLIRGTGLQGKVRAIAVTTTQITEQLRVNHDMSPTATAALGRTVAAALMIGAMLKNDEKVTIQIKGNGPIGQVVADANAKGEVRGYVEVPEIDLPLNAIGKLDVANAIGTDGYLYVIKDLGLKEPYRGSVPIITGEVAEDIAYYFAKSEQLPSAVLLGVLIDTDYRVKVSGGLVIQLLPGLSEQEIIEIEATMIQISSLTSLLDQGKTIEEILKEILPSLNELDKTEVQLRCKCSLDRVEQTLISLGKEELIDMMCKDGFAELTCHFCNQAYHLDSNHLQRLIDQI
jgi:molecular chaperone Hsp33